jgi:hypothetical protein
MSAWLQAALMLTLPVLSLLPPRQPDACVCARACERRTRERLRRDACNT